MSRFAKKSRFKCGAALSLLGFLAFAGASGQASAQSICGTGSTSDAFDCVDSSASPTATANGTYSAGASFYPNASGGFSISSGAGLSVALNGTVNSSSSTSWTSPVNISSSGVLDFSHVGQVNANSVGTVYGVNLSAQNHISALGGTINVSGGYGSVGLASMSVNGDNHVTGGSTTVSGTFSRGLMVWAIDGNNVTNTGSIVATGDSSWGVSTMAIDSFNGCDGPNDKSTVVNVTGNISAEFVGVVTLTCGTSTVNVLAGNAVQTTGNEGQTIRNIATGHATTVINGEVLAASAADVALDVRSASSETAIGSGGSLTGTFSGDEGNDVFTIASGGTWSSAGVSAFGGGSDSVTNSGTINAVGVQFTDIETFQNAGLIQVSGGSFNLTGASLFENRGTMSFASGETTITSNAVFNNNGVLNLQNGNVGDILTIANDYTAGANAALYIDVSDEMSDVLIVNGNQTGTTQIFVSGSMSVNNSGVLVAVVDGPSGPLSVQSGASATSGSSSFVIGNQASGLLDYRLNQVGASYYLLVAPNDLAFQPLVVTRAADDLWHQSANVVGSQMRASPSNTKPASFWGQLYVGMDKSGDGKSAVAFGQDVQIDGRLNTQRFGAQLGASVSVGSNVAVGLTGGYEKASAEYRDTSGRLKLDGWNVGLFGYLSNDEGFFGSVLAKIDWTDGKLTNEAFTDATNDPGARSFGVALDAGYRWAAPFGKVEASANVSYVDTKLDDFSAEGIGYDFASAKSVRGSVGMKATFGSSRWAPFVSGRVYSELDAKRELTLSSGIDQETFKANDRRTWGRLEAGLKGSSPATPEVGAWLDLGDVRGVGLRAGLRF